MKLLKDILYKTGIEDLVGTTNIAIDSICFDSRKVKQFSLFIAVRGTLSDGHQFINQAISKGAIAVVCEELPAEINPKITYVRVKESQIAMAHIAANFFDNPSAKLKLVGVTGTNGKTTIVTLLFQLFRSLGYKCGLISTVRNKIDNREIPATHTTPDSISLNELLNEMVNSGCTHCFMEVSSHAVVQHRVTGIHFTGGIFTNITHDHLDYHKTFAEYIKAKQGFFTMIPKGSFVLTNIDDANGRIMIQNSKAEVKNYSLRGLADFKCRIIENQVTGLYLNIDGKDVYTRLIGSFNAYNLLAVYGAAVLLHENKMVVLTALSNLESVEGRFQYIKTPSNVIGIVDYAHTPDALENVLKTIGDIRTGSEKVITVVGCGGDRDTTKRPVMARIACQYSDKVIITSDNPRSENPTAIIEQMQAGIPAAHVAKVLSISDRKEAIKTACMLSAKGDIILVAGKGHEKYQEISGVKYPFDDMEVLSDNFKMLC